MGWLEDIDGKRTDYFAVTCNENKLPIMLKRWVEFKQDTTELKLRSTIGAQSSMLLILSGSPKNRPWPTYLVILGQLDLQK